MKENEISLSLFPAGSSKCVLAFVLFKLIGTIAFWKLNSESLGIWEFESFL